MDAQWPEFCAVCAARDAGGELRIRGAQGISERTCLCTVCFGFLSDALRAAASGGGDCSLCGEAAGEHSLTLVPAGESGPGWRPPAGYRLCAACLGWTVDLLDGESLARWTRRPEGDGPGGEWPHQQIAGIAVRGLDARDAVAAARAASVLSRPFLSGDEAEAVNERVVSLVRATVSRAATAFLAGLPEARRAQVAVVGGPGLEGDVAAALALGAGEVLSSPLSCQQVLGAAGRLAAGGAGQRDAATGLPVYAVEARFGLSCYGLRIESREPVLETAFALRRFLRGYDAVGGDGNGHALALVYCTPDELDAVLRRVGRLLGEGATVNITGFAEAPEAGKTHQPARGLGQAAAAYFGTACRRAS
ncbi:MAG: hypothetical protein IT302_14280 [Dehalococcoidia bacterium]|nr:hypothetical protein [Dehalococcoidia bacterium]